MELKEVKMPGSYEDLEVLKYEFAELDIDRNQYPRKQNEDDLEYYQRTIEHYKLMGVLEEKGIEKNYNFNTEIEDEITYYRRKISENARLPIVNYGVGTLGRLTKLEDEHDLVFTRRELKLKKMLQKHDRMENETADKFYARIEKATFLGTIHQDNMGEISGDITTSEELSGRWLLDSINKREENVKKHFAIWERLHELEEEGYEFDRKDQNEAIAQFKKIFDERYMEHSDDDIMPDPLEPVDEREYIVTRNIEYDGEGNSRVVTTRAKIGNRIGEVSDKGLRISENEYVTYNAEHRSPLDDVLNRKELSIYIGDDLQKEGSQIYESSMTITPRDIEIGIHNSKFDRPRTPVDKSKWSNIYRPRPVGKDKESNESLRRKEEQMKEMKRRRKLKYLVYTIVIISFIICSIIAGKRYKAHREAKTSLANNSEYKLFGKEIILEAKGKDINGEYDFKTIIRPGHDTEEIIIEKIRTYESFVKNRQIARYKIKDINSVKNLVVEMTDFDKSLTKTQIAIIISVMIGICLLVTAISIAILAIKIYIIIKLYKCILGREDKKKRKRV